jgi:hypothetical protein
LSSSPLLGTFGVGNGAAPNRLPGLSNNTDLPSVWSERSGRLGMSNRIPSGAADGTVWSTLAGGWLPATSKFLESPPVTDANDAGDKGGVVNLDEVGEGSKLAE